ncbi:hypothetical protein GGF32_004331 [Allomyces javanicus]|nr:hypothetical protein GGF32_004331 [Allomyces javanicus]
MSSLADDLRHDPHCPLRDQTIAELHEYRRFLVLKVTHGDADALLLSPSPFIDFAWGVHLLDTQSYTAMCARLPVFIPRNAKDKCWTDAANLARRRNNTLANYRARWHEPPSTYWSSQAQPTHFRVGPPGAFQVLVRGDEGRTDVLYVRPTDTVARLHEQYHDLVDWTGAVELIRFFLGSRDISSRPEANVAEAGIDKDAIIDTVWHVHLLDTRAYLAMKEQLPFFFHHDPRGAYDARRTGPTVPTDAGATGISWPSLGISDSCRLAR